MRYVFLDPSGSFNEGKGHTGIAVMHDNDWEHIVLKDIRASDYKSRYEYWNAIISYVTLAKAVKGYETKVIIESFTIRANGFLVGKMPETLLLIGALCYELDRWKIPYVFQTPASAKTRYKDELLSKYIPNFERRDNGRYYFNNKLVNDHMRDALKHLLFYKNYKENR